MGWVAMGVGFLSMMRVYRGLNRREKLAHVICLLAREARNARSCTLFLAYCIAIWIYVQYRHNVMMKAKTTAFDSLNPSQRRAATFGTPVPDKGVDAGPMLILAGAGTGKTNTLAHRTAHLVLNGVDPARILMLTFTPRAAQDMTRRAQKIVAEAMEQRGKAGDRSVASRPVGAGTFHSRGSRIRRLSAKHRA